MQLDSVQLYHGSTFDANTYTEYADAILGKDYFPEWSSAEVSSDSCCIALDDKSGKLWVMLQKSDSGGGCEYRNLTPVDKKKFDAARNKEIMNLLDLGAYRILSLEESLEFRRKFPESVLPSRWVDRRKPTDDGVIPKSRIVILGFKDPHVLQLERSAPTPTQEAFLITCLLYTSPSPRDLMRSRMPSSA